MLRPATCFEALSLEHIRVGAKVLNFVSLIILSPSSHLTFTRVEATISPGMGMTPGSNSRVSCGVELGTSKSLV
jgi:hypothetical protein